MGIDEIN
ncbi:hypothetical protein CP02DC23_0003A, partial [Chlamydia psittaci 02DC23]